MTFTGAVDHCIYRLGGGGSTSTNTVQDSELQKQQASILKQLAPYITQYGQTQFSGLNAAAPGINSLLMQAMGQNSGAGAAQSAMANSQLRDSASKMGVRPGDPRMVASMNSTAEASTKSSLPEIQAIMSLYGMSPQNTLGMMGQGSAAGTTSKTKQSDSGADLLGTLGTFGILAKMVGIF